MKDFEISWRLNSRSKSSESPNTYWVSVLVHIIDVDRISCLKLHDSLWRTDSQDFMLKASWFPLKHHHHVFVLEAKDHLYLETETKTFQLKSSLFHPGAKSPVESDWRDSRALRKGFIGASTQVSQNRTTIWPFFESSESERFLVFLKTASEARTYYRCWQKQPCHQFYHVLDFHVWTHNKRERTSLLHLCERSCCIEIIIKLGRETR